MNASTQKLLEFIMFYWYLTSFLPGVCAPNTCKNDGSCSPVPKDGRDYTCTCVNGYSGPDCETGYRSILIFIKIDLIVHRNFQNTNNTKPWTR